MDDKPCVRTSLSGRPGVYCSVVCRRMPDGCQGYSFAGDTYLEPSGILETREVSRLTTGVTTIDTQSARTASLGAQDVAIAMVCVKPMNTALTTTVPRPDAMPAQAPARVIHLLYKPQIYGPMNAPDTAPQENDIKVTIGVLVVATT